MKLLLLFLFLNNPASSTDTTKPTSKYFIAMEYKGLSNCIYKVYITDSLIMGAKVNGYISVEPNFGIGTAIPKHEMHKPEAYVDKKKDLKYQFVLNDRQKFLGIDRQNFIIHKKDIKKIYNNKESKWGMGYYPYGGRIIIELNNSSSPRELILVGDQDPNEVLRNLSN